MTSSSSQKERRKRTMGQMTDEATATKRDLSDYPPVLTIPQVSEILQISENGTYDLCRKPVEEGGIPCRRFGRRVRVPKEQLVRFLQR
jgi:excisionase family DNA binding protein